LNLLSVDPSPLNNSNLRPNPLNIYNDADKLPKLITPDTWLGSINKTMPIWHLKVSENSRYIIRGFYDLESCMDSIICIYLHSEPFITDPLAEALIEIDLPKKNNERPICLLIEEKFLFANGYCPSLAWGNSYVFHLKWHNALQKWIVTTFHSIKTDNLARMPKETLFCLDNTGRLVKAPLMKKFNDGIMQDFSILIKGDRHVAEKFGYYPIDDSTLYMPSKKYSLNKQKCWIMEENK